MPRGGPFSWWDCRYRGSVTVDWWGLLDSWDAASGPRYRRLARRLADAAASGRLASGQALPSERVMADLLGVSRTTVVSAYDLLAGDGWVERRPGSGTRVAGGVRSHDALLSLRTPAVQPGDLDFTIAVPRLSAAQRAELARHAAGAFADHLYHPLGTPALRERLARQYTSEGLPTTPDQILVTSGAQQAIAVTVAALVRPGDQVLVESPTFFGAIDVLRASGATLVGAEIAALERGDVGRDPGRFALAFLTPTFQNPTGTVLGQLARERIARALRGVPLIEDETLIDLAFDDVALPARLAGLSSEAIAVGSLSKLYWSGLRVGWLRAPIDLLPRLAQAKTLADFGTSLPSQHLALALLEDLPRLRAERRAVALPARDLLVALLAERLPSWRFEVPRGGQFLWVELPTRNATGYTHVAARHGVRLYPGVAMGVAPLPDAWLRLPFTLPVGLLPEAVARMADAWAEFVRRDAQDRLA